MRRAAKSTAEILEYLGLRTADEIDPAFEGTPIFPISWALTQPYARAEAVFSMTASTMSS